MSAFRGRWWRGFAVFLAVFFTLNAVQQAQALRMPFPGKVNNLMVRVVQQRAARMGLNAADPRIAATVAGMGSAATDLAVSVAIGAVAGTPIGWAGIFLGAIAVAGVTYYMARGNEVSVQKNADGTISPLTGLNGGTTLFTGQQAYWDSATDCWGSSAEGAAMCFLQKFWAGNDAKLKTCNDNGSLTVQCTYTLGNNTNTVGINKRTYNGPVCASGVSSNGACRDAPVVEPTKVHPLLVADGLLDSDTTKPVSPSMMADTANRLWQDATTKPGYAGLPYSMTDPVTAEEVDKIRQTVPDAWPSVGDLTAPVAPGATVGVGTMPQVPLPANKPGVPTTAPEYTYPPQTGTNPNAETGTKLDLGPDPGTPAPSTGETATATSILDPIFNYVPQFVTAGLNVPNGQCPRPEMVIYNKTYTIQSHCDLVEQNRALLSACMLFVWAFGACLIVLRA